MTVPAHTLEGVKAVLIKTLGIDDRAETIDASTPLFGNIPELDSLAVVELAAALEAEFDFEIDEDHFSGDVFETVGTLAEYVQAQREA